MLEPGISSYTYGWAIGVPGHEPARPMDEHDLLDQVNEFGLKLLQIGDNLPLHTFDNQRLSRLADRAAAEGVKLEIGARPLTTEMINVYSGIARKLDARLIRFIVDGPDFHPGADAVVKTLRAAVPQLGDLTIGIENHDRFPTKILRQIVDAVTSEQVGVCLDTANSLGAGEGLETVLEALAPVAVNLHLKDFEIRRMPHMMGFTVVGTPLGRGMLDVARVLEQVRLSGRCRTAILELWTPPETCIEDTLAKEAAWAAESIARLKKY